VDVFRSDALEQLRGCHGFMWRHRHVPRDRALATRLLPVVERELRMPVYPDQDTCWHYDDKIAQAYLLSAAGVPTPRTWVFWDAGEARAFAREARYPLVLKLYAGASSRNVTRLDRPADALRWIERLFGVGTRGVDAAFGERRLGRSERLAVAARALFAARHAEPAHDRELLHRGYLLVQQLVPDTTCETRVMVIGDRAFGRRRINGRGDWRASGHGRSDPDPGQIDPAAVRLAFAVARRLGTQSLAVDMLHHEGRPLVHEVSYCFSSWKVRICPGHWTLKGSPEEGALDWCEGAMWGEQAQLADFLARLEAHPRGP